MKKLLAIILVLTLALSMGVVAFAEQPEPGTVDMTNINIEKVFKLTNIGTKSPAEEFTFQIEKVGVEDSQYTLADMPMFNQATFNVSFNEGEATDTNLASLTLPTYEHVGIFTYKITEAEGNTSGVGYDVRDLFLKVYVVNNPQGGLIRYATLYEINEQNVIVKVEGFENYFSAGNLEIKKEVTGNMGEMDRYFDITVNLTKPANTDISSIPVVYNGGQYATNVAVVFDETGVAKLELQIKHDDTLIIENLPYDVTWSVSENDYTGEGYATTINGNRMYVMVEGEVKTEVNGTIDAISDTVTITNHKEQNIETGINLDNLPYIIILVGATVGIVGFTMKKKFSDDK